MALFVNDHARHFVRDTLRGFGLGILAIGTFAAGAITGGIGAGLLTIGGGLLAVYFSDRLYPAIPEGLLACFVAIGAGAGALVLGGPSAALVAAAGTLASLATTAGVVFIVRKIDPSPFYSPTSKIAVTLGVLAAAAIILPRTFSYQREHGFIKGDTAAIVQKFSTAAHKINMLGFKEHAPAPQTSPAPKTP